jgi:hypothetical protein
LTAGSVWRIKTSLHLWGFDDIIPGTQEDESPYTSLGVPVCESLTLLLDVFSGYRA